MKPRRPADGIRVDLDCRDRQARMARIVISAEGTVNAPSDTVYRYVAAIRDHHPRFLPPAFSDF
jgi:hypothetical protein